MSSNRNNLSSGLTLMELLVSVSVIAVMSSIVWSSLSSYRDNQALSTGVETVLSAFSEARAKAVSSSGDRQYGVYLSFSRVVIFPGTTFVEANSLNKVLGLGNAITIASTSLSVSTSTIVFQKLTGETDNYGAITISLKSNPAKFKNINISRTGGVSAE